MADRDVENFLPQYKSERQWSDRKVEVMQPLFPGYIFVRLAVLTDVMDRSGARIVPHAFDRGRVLEIPGVLYLVGASGRPEALEDAEIDGLRVAMNGANPRPHELIERVKPGERVMVISGPMRGLQGFLVRDKGGQRVVVTVSHIERAMSVDVDAAAIVSAEGWSHISKSPHQDSPGARDSGQRGFGDGATRSSALALQQSVPGGSLSANGAGGICPQRYPGSSVGTRNGSIS